MTTIIHEPRTAPKTRRETLLDAAALIEEYGWTSGAKGVPGAVGHDGQLCMLGGIAKAMGLSDIGASSYIEMAEVIHGKADHPHRGMTMAYMTYDWNDSLDPAIGQSAVAQALRRLADGSSWEEAVS